MDIRIKYDRSGVLFQGKTKRKHVSKDNYYQYLKQYIYLNPVDLIEPNWKERGISDVQKVADFLKTYKWSSCKDVDALLKENT